MNAKLPAILLMATLQFTCIAQAISQKLPEKQAANVSLPEDTKVDGKASEWNNTYQAYNRQTSLYYTIANSPTEFYLIIQAKDAMTIKKIIGGGISFSVNKSGKRNDTAALSATFPLLKGVTQSHIAVKINERKATPEHTSKSDSLLTAINTEISQQAKEINIKGFTGISDSVISIYNRYKIRAKLQLSAENALVCELAFPIRYLAGLGNDSRIVYNIMVNGINSIITSGPPKADTRVVKIEAIPRGMSATNANFDALRFPTDFWGEYVLK